jgi:ubiquinone/menaquinone biosynthesis C-methylase UbiE
MMRRSRVVTVGLFAALLVAVLAYAQAPARHPVSGRPIAGVMGHQGASWLDRPEREAEEAPSRAIRALRIEPGQVVADIGAGSGYYSLLLSKAVGLKGRVYATDIQPEMLTILKGKLEAQSITNVQLVLGNETETKLPDASVDLAIMVDVYHELQQPQVFLQSVRRALKPGGRLVLIEFRKEDPQVPIREEHKMSIREARQELEADGYRFERVLNDLPWQHILVFGGSVVR